LHVVLIAKQTVSDGLLASVQVGCAKYGEIAEKRCLNMSLVNYMLVGILGTIVAIALYAGKWEMSGAVSDTGAAALTSLL
jgi:hypothetical protein